MVLAFGVVSAWPAWQLLGAYLLVRARGGEPPILLYGPLLLACSVGVLALVLLVLGWSMLMAIRRGLPRLSLTPDGLTLQTISDQTSVPWSRLGPFTESTVYAGRAGMLSVAKASYTTEQGARSSLTLTDAFAVPFSTILAEIRTRHPDVTGSSTAPRERSGPIMLHAPPVTYGPRRAARIWLCAISLAVGAGSAFVAWPRLFHSLSGGEPHVSPLTSLCALVLLGYALPGLVSVIRGVPWITFDPEGITLRTAFRRKSVPWSRLGTVTEIAVPLRRGRQRLSARAEFTTEAGSRRKLTIPDAFEVPFPTILAEIEARHRDIAYGGRAVVRAADVPVQPIGVEGFRWPWVTTALLAVFVAVFAAELHFDGTSGASPSVQTLAAMGGLHPGLVRSGEWYRLLTAPFLHLNTQHLVFNAIAFVLAGYALERYVGRAWMFSIFALGAIAGSAMSLCFLPANIVSVGASGAIMAMLLSLFAISFRLPAGRMKTQIQIQSLRIAVPALIPTGLAASAMHVDYAAHFGGALLGLVLGGLLLGTWEEDSPLPCLRGMAAAVCVFACLAVGASGVAVASASHGHPRLVADTSGLMPPDRLPRNAEEVLARAEELVAAYPADARAHLAMTAFLMKRGDLSSAAREGEVALVMINTNPSVFATPEPLRNTARGTLAVVYFAQKRTAEARAMAAEPCAAKGAAVPPAATMDILRKWGLCNAPAAAPR